jgi:hypothetical protein
MSKITPNKKTIYYQKARIFRKTNTNEYAYCIEPFTMFFDDISYEEASNPDNLTTYQLDRISKIAYFGYGYKNHTDKKWYAITQLMIWQIAEPQGVFYFTEGLNGTAIYPYNNEIAEVNSLIAEYEKIPSFSNQTITSIANKELIITDTNNVISNFTSNSNIYTQENNKLIFNNLSEDSYTIKFSKLETNYQTPILFYQANNSQNLVTIGNMKTLEVNLNINIIKTYIKIIKIDKDTSTIISQGEASLDGAKYELLNENMEKITEVEIINNEAIIEDIDFGKYYLKEITPGTGYTLDEELHEITISKENPKIEITLENKVIEKKITISKKYGTETDLQNEENIDFQVYNNNNELIKTISTDTEGKVDITLPYGEYKFVQINTTNGYQINDPFIVQVINNEDEIIELKDLKIPVPNTHTEKKLNIISLLLIYLLNLIC